MKDANCKKMVDSKRKINKISSKLSIILMIGAVLGNGFGSIRKTPINFKHHEQSSQPKLSRISPVEYAQLRIGMSLMEVRSILNSGN
ncbi:hypothetical protein, partial [Escherichia coli]|uniref:hypothetical protein n=1 Tax=Escherichia coli TaxID=562 RepID=UPI001A902B42